MFKCFMWNLCKCNCWLIIEVILRNARCNSMVYGTVCSETSAHKIQASRNYPKVRIQYSEHVESLKSRIFLFIRSSPPPPRSEVCGALIYVTDPSLYSKSIQISNCNSTRIFHHPTHLRDRQNVLFSDYTI